MNFLGLLPTFALMAAAGGGSVPVTVTVPVPEEIALVAGREQVVSIRVTVAPGFHVQANPASEKNLIPLMVEFEFNPVVSTGTAKYPAGQMFKLEKSSEPLSTYSGVVDVKVPLRANGKAGAYVLKGHVRYQACDATTCLFPAMIPIELDVVLK